MTMYKTFQRLFVIALACGFSSVAAAGTIVSIRAADVVQGSPQFAAGQAQLKTEFEKRKSDLEAEGRKLADDADAFNRDKNVMSADQRAKTEKDLQSRQIDFQYKKQKYQEDFSKRDRELTDGLMGRVKAVIEAVAKEKGADMVIQDPVYATPAVDITDEVLAKLKAAK